MQLATAPQLAALALDPSPESVAIRPEVGSDPVAGPALRAYLILTQAPDAPARLGLTPAEVDWSRYYWLRRSARLWQGQHGPDPALDQQVAALLDPPPADSAADCDLRAQVEMRVDLDSARILGDGPAADGPWFATLDRQRGPDGLRPYLGPLAGRNRVAAAFYDGPGWRRFRPVERLFLAMQGGTRRARRQILRHLDGLPADARVLEVGIGDGANLRFFPPGWTTYGVDIASAPLRAALRDRPALRDRLALAEAEVLPFAAATFDACLSVGGFNYYGDHAQALSEMTRVVRPGGRLVVADESPRLHRWGLGHLLGVPRLDAAWLRALGLDADFVALVHGLTDDPEAAVESAWPGATRQTIWAGMGYCYSATRPA